MGRGRGRAGCCFGVLPATRGAPVAGVAEATHHGHCAQNAAHSWEWPPECCAEDTSLRRRTTHPPVKPLVNVPVNAGQRTRQELQVHEDQGVGPVLVEGVEHDLAVAQVAPPPVEQQQAGEVLELRRRLGARGRSRALHVVEARGCALAPPSKRVRACERVLRRPRLGCGRKARAPPPASKPRPESGKARRPRPDPHLREGEVAGQHRRAPLPPRDPHADVRRANHADVVGAVPDGQRDGARQLLDQVGHLAEGW